MNKDKELKEQDLESVNGGSVIELKNISNKIPEVPLVEVPIFTGHVSNAMVDEEEVLELIDAHRIDELVK